MFLKGFIKVCKTAAPMRDKIFLLTVKSVLKKVITRATSGRSLVEVEVSISIYVYSCICGGITRNNRAALYSMFS